MNPKKLNIVDLFSGVGGFSLGAARAGFNVAGAIDNDKHAMLAHKLNFGRSKHLSADISTLSGKAMLDALGLQGEQVAGVIGGPPCQGFSRIGKRDVHDVRNQLFVEFFRIVSEVRPTFFIAENVPGIMSGSNSLFRELAISHIDSAYTVLPPFTASADQYGAPTSRCRVFFVGFISNRMPELDLHALRPPDDSEAVRVKHALAGLPLKIDPNWQRELDGWQVVQAPETGYYAERLRGHIPKGTGHPLAIHRLKVESRVSGNLGTAHCQRVIRRFRAISPGKRDRVSKAPKLHLEKLCPTIRAGTGPEMGSFQAVRPIHPIEPRVITPREAARMQGFPDWFTFAPTKWHSFRQIGNSVSPIVAERLLRTIRELIAA